MKKLLSCLVAATLVTSACTEVASASKGTRNGARVFPLEGGRFEVAPPVGSGGGEYWCAASDYARRYLGAGWQTQIFAASEKGLGEASGRKSTVVFTLTPDGPGTPQGTFRGINKFKVGDSMTVSEGDSECNSTFNGF